MKVVNIVGARPQFIKAAMVSRALHSRANVTETLIHTGQHYDDDMSAQFFKQLEIRQPDYNLEVGSATHAIQTANILQALESVLLKERPDWVLVYGDTNSTLAGTLAASQLNIPLAHVEAGLRSFVRTMPEEKNRIVADHLANLLFAPTEAAVSNLEHEGIAADRICLVGDVMFDAALYYSKRADTDSGILQKHGLTKANYVLATVHRAENTEHSDNLSQIFDGLIEISESTPVVFPVHPRTRKRLLEEKMLDRISKHLIVIPPVGYLDMIVLTKNSALVATDSGGLQKEAYFFQVPCITLRDETEWVELVGLNVNTLAGANALAIVDAFKKLRGGIHTTGNIYGQGNAACAIVDCLLKM